MANLMYPDYEYEEDEDFADYYDYVSIRIYLYVCTV